MLEEQTPATHVRRKSTPCVELVHGDRLCDGRLMSRRTEISEYLARGGTSAHVLAQRFQATHDVCRDTMPLELKNSNQRWRVEVPTTCDEGHYAQDRMYRRKFAD
eukprot:COSAG04_NODE_13574_length_600_cov_1.500998_1_plen_104_part_10